MADFARPTILHLTDRASERGGADWHLLGVLRELSREADVVLAVGRDDGTAVAPCRVIEVSGLDALGRVPVGATLDELCDELRPEIVHVHNVMNPSALEWAAARGAVMTVQDHRGFCPGRGKLRLDGSVCDQPMSRDACRACFADAAYFERIYAATEARLAALRRMRALTVLSSYMRDELASVGIERDRIHVIPPFVHGLEAAGEAAEPPCVLFAGRLVETKGADVAVEAWRRARVALPLVVAGTGSQRAVIESEGVEVLGWVPHRELARLYRRARVVVLPSRWQEPFGIVGLEALTLGVPVVAWDSGGVREWHPGEGLVAWGDVDGLADALRNAVERGPRGEVRPRCPFDRDELMSALHRVYEVAGPGGHPHPSIQRLT